MVEMRHNIPETISQLSAQRQGRTRQKPPPPPRPWDAEMSVAGLPTGYSAKNSAKVQKMLVYFPQKCRLGLTTLSRPQLSHNFPIFHQNMTVAVHVMNFTFLRKHKIRWLTRGHRSPNTNLTCLGVASCAKKRKVELGCRRESNQRLPFNTYYNLVHC